MGCPLCVRWQVCFNMELGLTGGVWLAAALFLAPTGHPIWSVAFDWR